MDSGVLFKRQAEVLINDKFSSSALKITKLRLTFEIEKYIVGSVANRATIRIYNLSRDTFASLKAIANPFVRLNVGYENAEGLTEIFTGDITNPVSPNPYVVI